MSGRKVNNVRLQYWLSLNNMRQQQTRRDYRNLLYKETSEICENQSRHNSLCYV